MKKMLSISVLTLAVFGMYFFSTNVQAFGNNGKPGADNYGTGNTGGGCAGRSGCECHSLDC